MWHEFKNIFWTINELETGMFISFKRTSAYRWRLVQFRISSLFGYHNKLFKHFEYNDMNSCYAICILQLNNFWQNSTVGKLSPIFLLKSIFWNNNAQNHIPEIEELIKSNLNTTFWFQSENKLLLSLPF